MKTRRLLLLLLLSFPVFVVAQPQQNAPTQPKPTTQTKPISPDYLPGSDAANSLAHHDAAYEASLRNIRRFATVIAQIKRYYIEPMEDKDLFDNAIRGMLTNLDPHSSYLDEEELQDLKAAADGKFGGVGVEVMPQEGAIKVISPLDDTPAFAAGMKAGDLIVRVNGELVRKMSMRDAINKIRGKVGSTVDLTVLRKDVKEPLQFKLTRADIKIKTVKAKLYEKYYGYIRIALFQGELKKELLQAITDLKAQSKNNLHGLVLDLRNNPGGLLDSAIDVSDMFLDAATLGHHKLIVYTKGRVPGADITANANGTDVLAGIPIVILINEGSASASEIVAGALQDHHRAIIMGAKSFGKGSVQTVIPIDYETGIKLTTALYYTPSGRSIQAEGIEPDVIVAALKIPDAKTEAVVFDPISERDLSGYIKNGKNKDLIPTPKAAQPTKNADETNTMDELLPTTKKTSAEDKVLAQQDYQLYEAINLLKGLQVLKK